MKPIRCLVLLASFFALTSLFNHSKESSWKVRVGKQVILSSEKNKPGDMGILRMESLRRGDSLVVTYQNETTAELPEIKLLLKDENEKSLKESKRKKGNTAYFSVSELLSEGLLIPGKRIALHITTYNSADTTGTTLLLARMIVSRKND